MTDPNNQVDMIVAGNERYIQINDIGMHDIERVWAHLAASYPGFVVDFCFTDSLAPEKFLLEIGAAQLENSLIMRLAERDFIDITPKSTVTTLTNKNFASFAACHDAANAEMYWTSQRLVSDIDSWDILLIERHGNVDSYALLRDGWELYCVHADSMDDKIALTSAAAKINFATNTEELMFWVERDNFTERGAAQHLGFRREGYYVAYRVLI